MEVLPVAEDDEIDTDVRNSEMNMETHRQPSSKIIQGGLTGGEIFVFVFIKKDVCYIMRPLLFVKLSRPSVVLNG